MTSGSNGGSVSFVYGFVFASRLYYLVIFFLAATNVEKIFIKYPDCSSNLRFRLLLVTLARQSAVGCCCLGNRVLRHEGLFGIFRLPVRRYTPTALLDVDCAIKPRRYIRYSTRCFSGFAFLQYFIGTHPASAIDVP